MVKLQTEKLPAIEQTRLRNMEELQKILVSLNIPKVTKPMVKAQRKKVLEKRIQVRASTRTSVIRERKETPYSLRKRGESVPKYNEEKIHRERENKSHSDLETIYHKFPKGPKENKFGKIPGIPVGAEWATRMESSYCGIHRPTVAGIHGKAGEGCYSLALSGGYEDDIDNGESFIYTGSGGRDLKGTKNNPKNLRTAPQTFDQEFTGYNASLKASYENGKPVRVIRGYKLNSKFSPSEGYRYDGLYKVTKAWREKGRSGFLICRFELERLPKQAPLPITEE